MKTDVIIIRIIAKDEVSTIFPVLPGSSRHKKEVLTRDLKTFTFVANYFYG